MIGLKDWIRLHGTFVTDPERKVERVDFQIETKDTVSTTTGLNRLPIYFTDIQFQAGERLTGWTPNPKEMMKRLSWTVDESVNVASPNRFEGTPPQIYENVERRLFNIVGRGHGAIVVPNYFPEDWSVTILPTGIDLMIYPKEDFDLLRISTNAGVWLPEDKQFYKQEGGIYQEIKEKYEEATSEYFSGSDEERKQAVSNWLNIIQPIFENHPIHKRYTREFWVDGAEAGSEIKVHAETRIATINGENIPIVGERFLDINGTRLPIDRKKFFIAPKGAAVIRIEFYRQRERSIVTYDNGVRVKKTFTYLEDAGIGYYGTASFYQWTHGRSNI